jgi:hypothetical protein
MVDARAAEWARVRGRAARPRVERTCRWVNFVGGFVLPADLTGDRQVERVPCLGVAHHDGLAQYRESFAQN